MGIKKIKPVSEFFEEGIPLANYFKQFKLPVLEVGKVYRQNGSIFWRDYKIIFIGEGVALGVEIANGNNSFSIGSKELFYSDTTRSGFKYNDINRPSYRLIEKDQ